MNKLLHNPRCSKSRQAKELLEEAGVSFEEVQYLKEPLTVDELRRLTQQLGISPIEMVRTKEEPFKKHGLDKEGVTDEQVLAAIAADPILLERPIFIKGDKAVIGRPPERVNELL